MNSILGIRGNKTVKMNPENSRDKQFTFRSKSIAI